MSRTIVFSSPIELAIFLWGEPGTASGAAPTHGVLMQAKQAWLAQAQPGGGEQLRMALMAVDKYVRQNYFYPPHDPVLVPGTPRQLIALGYRQADAPVSSSIFWSTCTMDVLDGPQTVATLQTLIDQSYGPGFFAKNIVAVRRVSDEELLVPKTHSFPAAEACDTAVEVV